MNRKVRNWNVINWNIRGLNDEGKPHAVRQKIEESCCYVFYIQETKMEDFTPHSFKQLAPKHFTKFSFSPSRGASGGGGILMGWNDSLL
jgi:exonuclease III